MFIYLLVIAGEKHHGNGAAVFNAEHGIGQIAAGEQTSAHEEKINTGFVTVMADLIQVKFVHLVGVDEHGQHTLAIMLRFLNLLVNHATSLFVRFAIV